MSICRDVALLRLTDSRLKTEFAKNFMELLIRIKITEVKGINS